MDHESDLIDAARRVVERSGLREEFWSVGEMSRDRYCLIRKDGMWVAGYAEPGAFHVEFAEEDTAEALSRFVALVRASVERTLAAAERTAEYMREHGEDRP